MGKRQTNRLTSVAINAKKTPGYYADGNGLYLQVSDSLSKSWILRYKINKRPREMGLGSVADRTLAEARVQRDKFRKLLTESIDPIAHREAERQRNIRTTAQRRTFAECAREYHKLHATTWKNAKHADQWINTLTSYAFPEFGAKDVSEVSKADVVRVLEPIWISKAETASRLRQRIRSVLDWAAARDYRTGHDPHMWDQVAKSLPRTKDVKRVKHFAACPYLKVYDAIQSIKTSGAGDMVKLAMEFTILNASRSGEVRLARKAEIDFDSKRWLIPGQRMKSGREHRVPLFDRAIEILRFAFEAAPASALVFPSEKDKPFSDMTFTEALRRLGLEFTMHGFRSTFRDWAAEQTAFPRDVCEAALAHVTMDNTEAAYFRSDLFEKRRQLMAAWAEYVATKGT